MATTISDSSACSALNRGETRALKMNVPLTNQWVEGATSLSVPEYSYVLHTVFGGACAATGSKGVGMCRLDRSSKSGVFNCAPFRTGVAKKHTEVHADKKQFAGTIKPEIVHSALAALASGWFDDVATPSEIMNMRDDGEESNGNESAVDPVSPGASDSDSEPSGVGVSPEDSDESEPEPMNVSSECEQEDEEDEEDFYDEEEEDDDDEGMEPVQLVHV